jgi:hypothetical protein
MNAADIQPLGVEKVDANHPARKIKHKATQKWAQKAVARMKRKGTQGSLTRMATAAGQSPMGYARAHYNSPGKVGAKARFAVNINS